MIQLDGNSLTLSQFKRIVRGHEKVSISNDARNRIQKSRAIVDKAVLSGEKIYSINTGFGVLSDKVISPKKLHELQENLIKSHCTGVGEKHTEEESRAILLLRTNVLAKGYSGVRIELVEFLVAMLNNAIHPLIPTKGSVGASGDLAPLAHLASVVIGEGEVFFKGNVVKGEEALKCCELSPLKLAPKEGLSLINGTQQMTGMLALLTLETEKLIPLSELIAMCSLEGVMGSSRAYLPWIHSARGFPGQKATAQNLMNYMKGSEINESHKTCDRVQDPYSFRCIPQVHGAVRDLFSFVKNTLSIEMNACTDNPLVHFETGEIVSNGNFHGEPIAFALDILAMGLSELSSISEQRIVKLITPAFSGLPTFLVVEEGLNSGFMISHVAAASLVMENRLLTHPASTDSMSTNNDKEDHVSNGPLGARKAKTILENTFTVLAIELLAACQSLDFRKPLKPGLGPRILYEKVRKDIPPLEKDRFLHRDIEFLLSSFKNESWLEVLYQEGLLNV